MTNKTFNSLHKKVVLLAHLLGAKEYEWGEQFNGTRDNYAIAFDGSPNLQHNQRHEFESIRAMHLYLNDKIKLFGEAS